MKQKSKHNFNKNIKINFWWSHLLCFQQKVTTKTANHPKPSKTTRNHPKLPKIIQNYLKPPKISYNQPQTTRNSQKPSTKCIWLILSSKILELYSTIFPKLLKNSEYYFHFYCYCRYYYYYYHYYYYYYYYYHHYYYYYYHYGNIRK